MLSKASLSACPSPVSNACSGDHIDTPTAARFTIEIHYRSVANQRFERSHEVTVMPKRFETIVSAAVGKVLAI